ncbi:Protein of unknown function [Cotesia congregata]|uniref:Phorbol-ester/DAG-type domain-containing protein n=1 Tax=Cotesia congregata TaxID=51543 RepID=A0A8J2MZE2_COTCN|nr:Protein of unknown function [Cotesia congregata]
MNCSRCNRPVVRPTKCKTCKLTYHLSCAKDVAQSKAATYCVKSFGPSLSPLTIPSNSLAHTSGHSTTRPASILDRIRRKSSQSSFKSINSLPKTPPITSAGEDCVFLSPVEITSPKMSGSNDQASQVTSKSASQSVSGAPASQASPKFLVDTNDQRSTDLPTLNVLNPTQMAKPDWTKHTLDEKVNALLDMSYNNSLSIQNVAVCLTKCDENATTIMLVKSTLDSLVSTPFTQQANEYRMSSQLLISGIPNDLNTQQTNEQITHQIFEKLNIANLTTDILKIREFKNKRRQSGQNSTSTSRSLIVKLKSPEICEHIIEVKRRSPKLLAKNVFNTSSDSNQNKLIYINEFLHPDIYKFVQKIKTKAKLSKIKYVWTDRGNPIVTSTSINILSLNINSYLAHLARFEALVKKYKPHLITVVETWLNPDISVSLDGYSILRRDQGLVNANGQYTRGGGVACFVHSSLKSKLLYSSESHDINSPEFIIVDIIPPTGSHILLSSIYRRPQGQLLDSFFAQFSKYYPLYNNVLIMGDLNCNMLKSERSANHLKSFISEAGLYCIPFGLTFHTIDVDSWLDVIIIDGINKLGTFTKSASPFIGGHDYLLCNYKLELKTVYDKQVTYRDFKNCDHQSLAIDLNNKLNLGCINLEDFQPNELVTYFLDSINSSLDVFAPFTTRKLRRPSCPWLTHELKREFHIRDNLYKRARRTKDANSLALYKKMRKELKVKLNLARDAYFKQILENSSQQVNIWSNLKRMGIIKAKKSSPLDHFEADDLNYFYANILRKHPSCSRNFVNSLPSHATRKVDSVFHWSLIDLVDVTKNLQITLHKSKGRSPDGFDLKWLRDHIPSISLFLMTIFNCSLNTGSFPDAWKLVMILGSNRRLKLLDNCDLPSIIIDGNVIPYVNTTKHLGIHVTRNLSWDVHVAHTTRKVYATLNCLKYRRNILSTPTRKLLRLVNNTIRFIFNLRRDEHITPYKHKLNWLTIKFKRLYALACFMFKLLNSGEPKFLRSLFIEEPSEIRRSERIAAKSNNILFQIPNFSTTIYEHSFVISAIRLWKELPTEVINSLSIDSFKNKAFEFFMKLEREKYNTIGLKSSRLFDRKLDFGPKITSLWSLTLQSRLL